MVCIVVIGVNRRQSAGKKYYMNILLVDDESFINDLMTLSLEELGFNKVCAEISGAGALRRLDAGLAPDVIFCDLNMPGMDGVELIRYLARRQFSGGVVLVSGEDWRILKTCEEMGNAFGLHLLGTLQKPFSPEEISHLLARVSTLRVAPLPKAPPILPDELRAAIKAGQMAAWFQPQLSVATRTLVAVEALVRWQHPQRGLIPPMAFIPVAEEHGLIDALLEKVYRDAMTHVGRWRQQGMNLRVAVNLSTDNLNSHDLPEQLAVWTQEAGMTPQAVMIEVTENRLSKNLLLSQEILTRLRLKGFGLSIDDFGTGYSSMEQLHRMPFTELKIDRGFVHGATRDSRSRAVFESSVQLARKLSMTTVAEGVEDEDDFRLAQEIGCDLVQGYYFAKPMPPEELQAWIVEADGVGKVARLAA